ncbi:MBL fold metallo-hydrolase [Teichococcus vastitatis]|uniref:MBL fold metallo-hydrolase n=1 Tax=Teichococcus vastitatis TaxID=2307076 RepID=A0ABS9W7X1_9PROT|nr:MBL fold metallo-hydrolase [Pseudoroseomonas vastitatis]MCI0755321.1 MBL fold metallo-hydrolase [Pseudoroseomonas vastitatis]
MSWTVEILLQGYPGKSKYHGGLGWSTVALARGPEGRIALLDTGGFGARRRLLAQLQAAGVAPEAVTDLLLTHLHYDHCLNWPMFPKAAIHAGDAELEMALCLSDGDPLYPEFTVRALARHPRLRRLRDGETGLPGVTCFTAPGHTLHHLVFVLDGVRRTIFSADVAKNRAELASGRADMTLDAGAHAASIARLNALWREVPGTVLMPGHDLALTLDAAGGMVPHGQRACAIEAWFTQQIEDVTRFDLTEQGWAGSRIHHG